MQSKKLSYRRISWYHYILCNTLIKFITKLKMSVLKTKLELMVNSADTNYDFSFASFW
jgi:hypothetical protein